MGLQEGSVWSVIIGIGVSASGLLLHQLVKRFDPEFMQKAKSEEQKAEEETWKRARELIASYSKEKEESDKKIAKLESKLDDEIAKRTKLEEELKLEIKKRDQEILELKEQIKSRDTKIEQLTFQVQAQGKQNQGKRGRGLPG